MADSQIRWKHGDYISLGKAVANFNKKINELKTEENALLLPDEISYSELKRRYINKKRIKQTD